MSDKSHICLNKLDKVPAGSPFEYKDIVQEDFALENHTEDGKVFKSEVQQGSRIVAMSFCEPRSW